MVNLTPKEISFIETYLKNSGVRYFDVRLEMTDHIASEIEERMETEGSRDFYKEFKKYMSLNKKTLLKSMNRYRWQADKKLLLKILHNTYKPKTIAFAGMVLAVIFGMLNYFSLDLVPVLAVFGLSIVIAFFVYYLKSRKRNYLYLDRLYILFFLINHLVLTFTDHLDPWVLSVLVIFDVAVFRTLQDLFVYYKKNYEIV